MKRTLQFFLVAALLLTGCTKNPSTQNENLANVQSQEVTSYKTATIYTNLGKLQIELFSNEAPKTINNFGDLVKSGFYDGTKIHYISKDKMALAGDPNTRESNRSMWGFGTPGYNIQNEINNKELVYGSIATVPVGNQAHGSQFMLVLTDNLSEYKGKVTNFGKVISGLAIIEKINETSTDSQSKPQEDIIIQSIEIK